MRRRKILARMAALVGLAGLLSAVAPPPAGTPSGVEAAPRPHAPAPAAAPTRAPTVSVAQAERGTIIETLVVTGTLVPREEIMVNVEIDGLAVTEILVEEGDSVKTGQILARLSRATIEALVAQQDAVIARANAAIAQAKSQVAEAQTSKIEADKALERARQLRQSGTVSVEQFDQRNATAQVSAARLAATEQGLAVAEAERNSAQAIRRELGIRLARTEIKAPAAGVISRRTARYGAVAGMAGEPLFRIVKDGAIELEAEVPETALARFPETALARFKEGMGVEIVPAGRTAPVSGRIRLVAPEIDRASRLGRVRVAIPDPAGLKVGAYARGVVEIARSEGVVAPLSAVLMRDGAAQIQVVRDGAVETRNVTLGLRHGGKVEIVSGLQAGESVVALSGIFVRSGDRVTAVPATAK